MPVQLPDHVPRWAPFGKLPAWWEAVPSTRTAGAQQACVEGQVRSWRSSVASHLEPSVHAGTNRSVFHGLL